MTEYFNASGILLPTSLFALAFIISLVFIFKRRSLTREQNRNCPHCRSIVDANQAECDFCHRKIIYI